MDQLTRLEATGANVRTKVERGGGCGWRGVDREEERSRAAGPL